MNRSAVITGAARGIGFAIAKKCLLQNIDVIAVDININALKQAEQELQQFGKITTFSVDLSIEKKVQEFANTVLHTSSVPHYLFNNAGIGGDMLPVWQQDTEKFKQVMDVNFYSAFYLIKAFLPAMLENKITGKIINIASMASFYTAPLINSYVISKHSIMALSECLYHDLQAIDANIQVAVVCPGGVRTSILDENLQSAGQYETVLKNLNDNSRNFVIKFAKLIKKGMSADTVAEIIFAGIDQKQFYIFTHPDMIEIVTQRFAAIIEGQKPQTLNI